MNSAVGELRQMDRTGDTRIKWNRNNDGEVAAARAHFDALKNKGYIAYKADGETKGEVIKEFDPSAREIIMAPPTRGG